MPTDDGVGATGNDGTAPWGQSDPPAGKKFKRIAVGVLHSCGILESGDIECWGAGTSAGESKTLATCGQAVPQAGRFIDLALGTSNSCGVLETGKIKCWGSNTGGRSTPPADFRYCAQSSVRGGSGLFRTACWHGMQSASRRLLDGAAVERPRPNVSAPSGRRSADSLLALADIERTALATDVCLSLHAIVIGLERRITGATRFVEVSALIRLATRRVRAARSDRSVAVSLSVEVLLESCAW